MNASTLRTFFAGALAAALLAAPAADAVSRDNRCVRLGERHRVVEQTRSGLLFAKSTSDGLTLHGCLFRSERPRRLGPQYHELLKRAVLEGRYAAHFSVTADDEDAFGYITGIRVRDLRTGKLVTAARLTQDARGPATAAGPGAPAAGRIVLRADGAVAWIGGFRYTNADGTKGADWEVLTSPAPGEPAIRVDEGPGIDPESLAKDTASTRFYWLNGGEPRSAQLGR